LLHENPSKIIHLLTRGIINLVPYTTYKHAPVYY